MRHPPLLLACALALPLGGADVRAQEKSHPSGLSQQDPIPPGRPLTPRAGPPPAAPPPAGPPTLAQALEALDPPRQDLFLTVGADKVRLPPGDPPPDPDARPGQVGAAYGRLVRDFGGVMALAPPTMTVLNTEPGVPSPYDGLPTEEALKLLLAGLTPSQWAALTGEAGLGVSDLEGGAQRACFEAVLPAGELTALPEYSHLLRPRSWEPVTLAARDVGAARLRLGRRMRIGVPMVGDGGTSLVPLVSGGTVYNAAAPPVVPPHAASGAVLRETLPNDPKAAALDYAAAALTQSVSVAGLGTVGDLVARVGRAAGLELYADRRYEGRRVTLLGRRTARGVDLLRAAAFCLTGTFRRVGPAYVLTDDLQGTATRRLRLVRFVQQAGLSRRAATTAAEDSLAAAHGGADALPWLGGLGFSDAQRALPQFDPFSGGSAAVPFARLTPAQQAFVLGYSGLDRAWGKPFTLQARPTLLLLSPAAPGPCTLDFLTLDQLFQPSLDSIIKKDLQKTGAARGASPFVMPAPVPPAALKAALAMLPRRAVLVAPRTPAEVGGVVAAMKVLGLNQLWLDVFSGGHPHLDTGILAEALARTRGTGIVVVPALDLLHWGVDAPEDARDLTALGETSAQQAAWKERHAHHLNAINGRIFEVPFVPPSDLWACPAAPAVETTLEALVRRLAATPGVTTVAVRDAVPPGYEHPPGADAGIGESDLGYVPALRLLFLRRDHLDPLDLDTDHGGDYALPEFDGQGRVGDALRDWGALKDGVSRDLLRRLLAAGREASGGRLRLLVQPRGGMSDGEGSWYGLWDDPQVPPPGVPAAGGFGLQHPAAAKDPVAIAHSQSRVALYAFPAWYASSASPDLIADALRRLEPGWDGVTLDATGPAGVAGLERLAGMIPFPMPGKEKEGAASGAPTRREHGEGFAPGGAAGRRAPARSGARGGAPAPRGT